MSMVIGEIRSARRGQRLRRWAPVAGLALAAGGTVAAGSGVQPFPAATLERDDELIVSRAQLQLRTDPTAAIETLVELSAEAKQWNGLAQRVAEQAEAWGLVDREIVLAPEFRFLAFAGNYGFGYRENTGRIVAVDLRTAAAGAIPSLAPASDPPMPRGPDKTSRAPREAFACGRLRRLRRSGPFSCEELGAPASVVLSTAGGPSGAPGPPSK